MGRPLKWVFGILVMAPMLIPMVVETALAADGHMYWTDAAERTIKRANLDGSSVQSLVLTGAAPQSIALDAGTGKMYWAEADGQRIRRANLDGSSPEDLVASVGPAGLALDTLGGKIYWTDVFVTGWIQRANLNGTAVETLNAVVADREAIAVDVDGGKMYWTNRSRGAIERSNLDGTHAELVIASGLNDPRGIALDTAAGKMYWAELGSHKIRRANLDGTASEDLVSGLENPCGITLDLKSGQMYWTDFGTHKVQRASLDGSGVQDLAIGLSLPVGIALEVALQGPPPGPPPGPGDQGFGVYEDWTTSSTIRSDRWAAREDGQAQEVALGIKGRHLVMRQRRQGLTTSNTGVSSAVQTLLAQNPSAINRMEVDVHVRNIAVSGCAANPGATAVHPALLAFTAFNDGTPGGQTGDHSIQVQVNGPADSIDPGDVMTVQANVVRCSNPACSVGSSSIFNLNVATLPIAKPFTLRATWDRPNSRFLVGVNGDPDVILAYPPGLDAGNARVPTASVRASAVAANCAAGAGVADSEVAIREVRTNSSAIIP
jgi:low density lipoprotein receptor-related protein 5/6